MFETGMSSLVLKICSEYAKALGLNFPPCVQQEINAIAQYVDLHTVKDLIVEQDGSVVTITCYTEGEQEKVFTVTLPEINVDTLSVLIKGSSTVVVDKSEDGSTLVVRLDKSLEVQSIRLFNPEEPLTADELAILKANQENYILLYGSSIYKLQSAYVRDENTCVYSAADLSANGTAGITNVVVNMTTGKWNVESANLQNDIIYVELTPSTATKGTLTSSQWDILEKDKSNCIILNNEIYRLADNQNVAGLITYVHTGWDGTARKDKSISITVSTKAWTLVVAESSGGKLYRHFIGYTDNNYNSFGLTIYLTQKNTSFSLAEFIAFTKEKNISYHLSTFSIGESGKITGTYYLPKTLSVSSNGEGLVATGSKPGVALQDGGNVSFNVILSGTSNPHLTDTVTEL